MLRLLLFILIAIPITIVSWRALFSLKNHGFYRFFSWLCIDWLVVSNYEYWFYEPFCIRQIFSWILLVVSIYPAIAGAVLLKKKGKPEKERTDVGLYNFEQTTKLVETGIYRYIRHPLYCSLILLTWGICLKYPTLEMLAVAVLSTVALSITAKMDEKECIIFFGDQYKEYMTRTKRFIPFIF